MKNYQYQQDYDDALITYLFTFNSINFYLPTLIVAVLTEYFDFVDVYTNVLIQMVFNQYIANIQETFAPKWASEKRLEKLDQDFEACLIDSQNTKKLKKTPKPDNEGFVSIDDNLSYEYRDHEARGAGSFDKDKVVSNLRKHYQALRDYSLFAQGASVLDNYMELVSQFGYVILFA